MIRDLLRNISWLSSANIAVKPFWFLFMTLMCARLLDTEEYGIFTATLSLGLLGGLITDLGTARYSVREVARERSNAAVFYSNFLTLRLILSLFAFSATLVAGTLLGYSGTGFMALVFASIYTLSLNITDYSRSYFQAFERLKLDGLSIIVEKTLVIIGGASLLYISRSVNETLLGMAIGMALTAAGCVYFVSTRFARFRRASIDWSFIRTHLRRAIPLGLTGAFAAIYYRTDTVMIAAFLGDAAAGQYGLAFRVMDSLNLLPVVVSFSALFPRLSRLWHAQREAEFVRLLTFGLAGLAVSSLILASLLTYFAAPTIHLLAADPAYNPSVSALQILSWTFPLNCIHSLLSVSLVALDELRYLAWTTFVSVVINIGVNIAWIPLLGIDGAAYTTMLSAFFLVVAYGWRCWRAIGSRTNLPPS